MVKLRREKIRKQLAKIMSSKRKIKVKLPKRPKVKVFKKKSHSQKRNVLNQRSAFFNR